MPSLVQVWQRQAGLAKEAAWGTAVAETDTFPISSPRFEDKVHPIPDNGYRGTRTKDQGWYQGSVWSEVDGEMAMYPDTGGHVLMGLLGSDTLTGAGPYTHTLKTSTGLPPSYTWTDYTGATATGQARQFAGHYFSEAVLRYTAANEFLKVTFKSMGKQSTIVAKPTAAFSTQAPVIGWQGALTLNSAANARLISNETTFRAPVELVKGSGGTQQPDFGSQGQLEVTGKASFAVVDETDLLLFLNNTQPVLSLPFTSGANSLTLTMSKCAFEAAVVASGKDYFVLDATYRAVYNATDAGPASVVLINSRSMSY